MKRQAVMSTPGTLLHVLVLVTFAGASAQLAAQAVAPAPTDAQMERLAGALNRTEAELAATQQEMQSLRSELDDLRRQLAQHNSAAEGAPAETSSASQEQEGSIARRLQDVEERQALEETQIATHAQAKVESESKYPVRITGMILVNSFVNTGNVDDPATPTLAIPGTGSTGISLRQSILGLDAQGPHLFGARTSADIHTDFSGAATSTSYSGGLNLLRLRTAHANIEWKHTAGFFSIDRPILNPNAPASLTAVAQPALAWSGNLWNWNPQFGVSHDVSLFSASALRVQSALIDPSDPPVFRAATAALATLPAPTSAERSRFPGVETRLAWLRRMEGPRTEGVGTEVGVGGYYSPHRLPGGYGGNSWAATLDYRFPLPARLEWSGSAYRGQGLGGLGGGAYKDYVFRLQNGQFDLQFLDDVGGWTQLKQRVTERLEWNTALGVDNAFSGELRPYVAANSSPLVTLARNRTFTSNVIYSPSAYLLFSLEYRNVRSTPVNQPASVSNVIGAAAGYRF